MRSEIKMRRMSDSIARGCAPDARGSYERQTKVCVGPVRRRFRARLPAVEATVSGALPRIAGPEPEVRSGGQETILPQDQGLFSLMTGALAA
jgi:hypothetical protein